MKNYGIARMIFEFKLSKRAIGFGPKTFGLDENVRPHLRKTQILIKKRKILRKNQ